MPSLLPQTFQQWKATFRKLRASGRMDKLPIGIQADTFGIGADLSFQAYKSSNKIANLRRALELWQRATELVPMTDPSSLPYGRFNYLLALWDQCEQTPNSKAVETGLTLSSLIINDGQTSVDNLRKAKIISSRFSISMFEIDGSVDRLTIAVNTLMSCAIKEKDPDHIFFATAIDHLIRHLQGARDRLLKWPGINNWLATIWRDIAVRQSSCTAAESVVLVEEVLKLTCELGDVPAPALRAARNIFDSAPADWKVAAAGQAYFLLGMTANTRLKHSEKPEDLDSAISAFEQAIVATDTQENCKAIASLQVARLLIARSARLLVESDLDRAVETATLAHRLSASDDDLRRDASRMMRIAKIFRDVINGSMIEFPESEIRQTFADFLSSSAHADQCAEIDLLGSMALAIGHFYEESGRIDLLERAVAISTVAYTKALECGCDRHLTIIPYARSRISRYERVRDGLDLDNVLSALSGIDPEKASTTGTRLNIHQLLGDAIHHDISRTANWKLLDEVIFHYQEALNVSTIEQEKVLLQEKLAATLFHKSRTVGFDEDARRAFDLFEDAWQRNCDPRLIGHLTGNFGTSLLKFVEDSSDVASFNKAISLLTSSCENTPEHSTAYPITSAALMYAHQRRAELLGAAEDLRKAISVGEAALLVLRRREQQDVRYKMGDQAVWYRVRESLVESYMSLRNVDADPTDAMRRAFEVAESSKEGLLIDYFGDVDTDMAARFFRNREDIPVLTAQILQNAIYGDSTAKPRNGKSEPSYPTEVTWAAAISILKELGSQTVFLSCFLGQRKSWWFLVSSKSTKPIVIESDIGRPAWLRLLQRLRDELVSPPDIHVEETWLADLSDLAALGAELRSFRNLVISNHQMTAYLPWNVIGHHMRWRSFDEQPMSIATVSSFKFLLHSSRDSNPSRPPITPSQSPLVIGNPLNDLAHAEAEALTVSAILDVRPLIGPEATVVAVRDRMQDTMLLHFACHGEFYRDRDPVALCLADGVLSARDILSCRLSAKLVVLSACWSGVASKAAREEYFGLAEAFLIAGVESVVVALWEVDDEVSSEFFKEFYLRWQKGLVAADALKDAMEVISAQPQWSHPHWWGPFVTRGFAAHRSSPAAIGCE